MEFNKIAEDCSEGAYNLELVRLCRMFSTAPTEEHKYWERAINIACRLGHRQAIREFGFALYNWAAEHKPQRFLPLFISLSA